MRGGKGPQRNGLSSSSPGSEAVGCGVSALYGGWTAEPLQGTGPSMVAPPDFTCLSSKKVVMPLEECQGPHHSATCSGFAKAGGTVGTSQYTPICRWASEAQGGGTHSPLAVQGKSQEQPEQRGLASNKKPRAGSTVDGVPGVTAESQLPFTPAPCPRGGTHGRLPMWLEPLMGQGLSRLCP